MVGHDAPYDVWLHDVRPWPKVAVRPIDDIHAPILWENALWIGQIRAPVCYVLAVSAAARCSCIGPGCHWMQGRFGCPGQRNAR